MSSSPGSTQVPAAKRAKLVSAEANAEPTPTISQLSRAEQLAKQLQALLQLENPEIAADAIQILQTSYPKNQVPRQEAEAQPSAQALVLLESSSHADHDHAILDAPTKMEQAWRAHQNLNKARENNREAYAQWQPYKKLDPTECLPKDVWMGSKDKGQSGILSFVPPGNFRSVKGVNHQLKDLVLEADPWLVHHRADIWMRILSFVGPGHYLFVAGVNRQMKKYYLASFAALDDPPKVKDYYRTGCLIRYNTWTSRQAMNTDTFYRAAFSSVACAEYWKKHANQGLCRLAEDDISAAMARYGNLDVLEWARAPDQHYPWNQKTCEEAAANGNLELLKFLHENEVPWGSMACAAAAEHGHLGCLKYLHVNGCRWSYSTTEKAVWYGHLECLQYALGNDCPCDVDACDSAAFQGHIECLKSLHKNNCEWNWRTCASAARNGHLECLQYALDNDCPRQEKFVNGAWLPLGTRTCSAAAENGHLECLKYCHEQECAWDAETCSSAAGNGHLDCLQYLHQNGCPWDVRTYGAAREKGYNEIAEWAKNRGCPTGEEESSEEVSSDEGSEGSYDLDSDDED